jgi:hypothetical protein
MPDVLDLVILQSPIRRRHRAGNAVTVGTCPVVGTSDRSELEDGVGRWGRLDPGLSGLKASCRGLLCDRPIPLDRWYRGGQSVILYTSPCFEWFAQIDCEQ